MNLIDYIDYRTIFERIKSNHLKELPTVDVYTEELKDIYHIDEDRAKQMYKALEIDFSEYDTPNSNNSHDSDILKYLNKEQLLLEFYVGGDASNESGDNYWGYAHQFTIDLEEEIFIDYSFENYS